MGGSSKQNDPGVAKTASAGSEAAGQASADLSRKNQADLENFNQMMWGNDSKLKQFAEGGDLGKVAPEGVYQQGYQQTVKEGEKELGNRTRGIFQTLNNRGLGMDSGVAREYQRQNSLDAAESRGQAYAGAVQGQHNEALQNFWGANDIASQQSGAARGSAVTASSNAGQTYNNLYSTAGAYHFQPSAAGSIIGAGLQAGGQVGAAAMCPAEGSLIKTPSGPRKAEDLDKGDEIIQIDGTVAKLRCRPRRYRIHCVAVKSVNGFGGNVSDSHTYARTDGGYSYAAHCSGEFIRTENGNSLIESSIPVGIMNVFRIETEDIHGNHTYCADGLWSLE